jgi:hypothetical protein
VHDGALVGAQDKGLNKETTTAHKGMKEYPGIADHYLCIFLSCIGFTLSCQQ